MDVSQVEGGLNLEASMFEVLIASQAALPPLRAWPAKLTSLAAHAGIVALAAAASRQPPPATGPQLLDTAIVLPRNPGPRRPAPPVDDGAAWAPGAPIAGVFAIPDALPPVDLPPAPAFPRMSAPGALPGIGDPGPVAVGPPTGEPVGAIYTDEPPRLLAHPELRYPEVLRQAGIEGAVVVEAVVDTLGVVEPGSARVVRGAHPLFDSAALVVVNGSRYRPAFVGAHKVRVRIQVPVTFTIRR